MLNTILCILISIAFVYILANPKVPNSLLFLLLAPILILTHILDAATVWGFFANNSLHLVMIISVYASLMAVSGFDEQIGETFERMTRNIHGKNRERGLFGIIFVLAALCSTIMANSSVTMAMVPALYGISRRMKISRSKLVLFVIYASTLGGACTLIGTDTNIFANAALEEAGITPFAMFDFAWVGIPIAILGGIYMVMFHHLNKSYDDLEDADSSMPAPKERTDDMARVMKRQQTGIFLGFFSFILILLLNSFDFFKALDINAYAYGYLTIGLLYGFKCFSWKEVLHGFNFERMFMIVGLLAVIKMITNSSLGNWIGALLEQSIGGSTSMYFIFTVLFIVTVIITQFMNNMAACGVISPIAITIAGTLGADPRAFIMAIAIAAGCGYMTPFASGTNQRMSVFAKSTIVDYMRYGWPLIIITYLCALLILPHVFPFF